MERNTQEKEVPVAMCFDDEEVDLLSEIAAHECFYCGNPLQKLTKVIVQLANSSEINCQNYGYRVCCVPCFCGWSPSEIDPSQIDETTYNYYVCRRIDNCFCQLNGWSFNETIQLLACVEKFGRQKTEKWREQFMKRTGVSRSQEELQQKCQDLYEKVLQGEKIKRSLRGGIWKEENVQQVMNISKAKSLVSKMSLSSAEQQKKSKDFLKIINYGSSIDQARRYPDNRANYLSRALATSLPIQQKIVEHSSAEFHVQNINMKSTVRLLSKFLREKQTVENQIVGFVSSFCQRYATFRRRERKQAKNFEEKAKKQLQQLSNLQISKLIKIQGVEVELRKIMELKKQRQELLEEVSRKRGRMNVSYHSSVSHLSDGSEVVSMNESEMVYQEEENEQEKHQEQGVSQN